MGQVGRNLVKKIPGRNNLFVILLLIFTFLINSSFSLFENSYVPAWPPLVLSKSKLLFIGTFLLAIVIISAIIILFSVKLRRVNRMLAGRNKIIENINNDLQKTNSDPTFQKDLISKEYSESDKFYQ